jgi:hypothetical protein
MQHAPCLFVVHWQPALEHLRVVGAQFLPDDKDVGK